MRATNVQAPSVQVRDENPRLAPVSPWPVFGDDERAAVERVLASGKVNYWTGDEARAFEREYAAYLGVRHAVGLMNGTVALELPLRCWSIGAGDEVVVTPRSFIASVSCAVLQGATPVFADVDRDSGNITAESIARVLTARTRAIILVHLAGWPCDMDPIMDLARRHGIKVLEDCAQAHGGTYKGRQLGSIGDAGAFSFCQDKILSTGGEGGLLVTNDDRLWRDAWSFKDHGKNWDAVYNRQHGIGYRWLHESFGTNWRMTELQAAIGRLQLGKLPQWRETRARHAAAYHEAFAGIRSVRMPTPAAHSAHAWYKFYAYLEPGQLRDGWDRERILREMTVAGVPCFVGSCGELYREKAFDGTAFVPPAPLQNARELGETSLMFLVHPTLGSDEVRAIAAAAAAILRRASRD